MTPGKVWTEAKALIDAGELTNVYDPVRDEFFSPTGDDLAIVAVQLVLWRNAPGIHSAAFAGWMNANRADYLEAIELGKAELAA